MSHRTLLGIIWALILFGAQLVAVVLALVEREWLLAAFPLLYWALPARINQQVRELAWLAVSVGAAALAWDRGHVAYAIAVLVAGAALAIGPPLFRRARERDGAAATT